MKSIEEVNRNSFLYPRGSYHGNFTPENLTFNANLQEFALRISFIAGLHTGGKLSSQEAYEQVKDLWQQLRHSKYQMESNIIERQDLD